MRRVRSLCWMSAGIVMLLLATSTQLWAIGGVGGPSGSLGVAPLGGEHRGVTGVTGRVLCAQCDLKQVAASQPALIGLYELQHRQGQIVMQLARPEDASAASYWEAILGMKHVMAVRTPDAVFAQLMAEENHNRRVGIQGLLRPTRTYDITNVLFLEGIRQPLSKRSDLDAAARAEAAASQAERAASRTEQAAERLESASRMAEAQFNNQLRK